MIITHPVPPFSRKVTLLLIPTVAISGTMTLDTGHESTIARIPMRRMDAPRD